LKTVHLLLVLLCLLAGSGEVKAQELDNIRHRALTPGRDTVRLDTLSIIPGSLSITSGDKLLPSSACWYEPFSARILLLTPAFDSLYSKDPLVVHYRVYPFSFAAPRFLRDRRKLESSFVTEKGVYTERTNDTRSSLFGLEGLSRSGSIARGLSIGTNQDAVVNSSLNLQLAGRIRGDIDVVAAITDENIPVQAEGNTQQLQEFDRVFIQLSNEQHKLIAGDYDVRNPEGYFMRYFKKAQGGLYAFNGRLQADDTSSLRVAAGLGAAISRGKFARNVLNGIESNQGPYRLRGAENELFIIVMSNSERVFIDGLLLERGQDRDYIIDYNTAEITFTTRRLINKDMRIIVEFQYADRNYARTLLTGFTAIRNERLSAGLNIYSEQDSKNQPLQQDLSLEDKQLLAAAGDSLGAAFADGADSVAFNINEVLYARSDTVVGAQLYLGIYRYSSNPDSAFFRVSFSNVGVGKGNYIAVDGLANGRVYRWLAPVNGVPQGSYEPKILLVSPKQRQMASTWFKYQLRPETRLGVELAVSKDDVNRFATKDKANDDGLAARLTFDDRSALQRGNPAGWNLVTQLQVEVNDEKFRPVEVYRPVEFVRDWNTGSLNAFEREWLSNLQVGLSSSKTGDARYGLKTFLRGDGYKGWMQTFNGNMRPGKWTAKWDASLLTSEGQQQSSFLRHRDEVTRQLGSWIPGIRFEQERNRLSLPGSDSLTTASFHFRIADVFITRPDTVRWMVKAGYTRREDDGPTGNDFRLVSIADMAQFSVGWNKTPRQKLSVLVNYRNLRVLDTLLTPARPEESATGRTDYSLVAARGAIQVNSFYEGGTGREARRLYSYVEVAPGTGTYTWIDYNADGVPQLNEFEVAAFRDQANYIRILANTDDYIKVFFNQFNTVLNLQPSAWFTSGKKPFWARFSLLSSVRFDNRITGENTLAVWNPFPRILPDSLLLSTQANSRHTLFFDRTGSVFAADITYQDQQVRQLLANGLESRGQEAWSGTVRWNVISWMGLQQKGEWSSKQSAAEAFTSRNFDIDTKESDTRLNFQPGQVYRISGSFRYKDKINVSPEGSRELAIIRDVGLEWRYNSVRKGIITAKFNLVQIAYNSDPGTSLAFEMLEGLRVGENMTWSLSVQRSLGSSLQLSLNYEGRKPSGLNIIHTGGAQVRAFF
jgi:hypothetical protein